MRYPVLLYLPSFALAVTAGRGLSERSFSAGLQCCSRLQNAFGTAARSLVSFRNTTVFDDQQTGRAGYWTQQESSVLPRCRLTPTCAEDVSLAVTTLAQHDCQFAIRGGGHMSWAGAANIHDGVTIDLSEMNTVEVSVDRKITGVGPGARWHDVYIKLDALGLSVVGGRVSDVGVAGLTLGGGNSFFAAQHGFACDHVSNFEVVLASGRIVNVHPRSNPQLFKALKGGGNNFGIVTRFEFKTFVQSQLWAGFIFYPYQTSQLQLRALENFTRASGKGIDPYASVINAYIFGRTGPQVVANQYTYTKPKAYPAILRPFTEIRPEISNSMRIARLANITDEVGAGTPNGYRQLFGTATIANNATLFAKVLEIAERVFQPLRNVTDFQASVVLQPISRSITAKGALNGGNSLGLEGSGDLVFLDLTIQWSFPKDDRAINKAAETLLRQTIAFAKSKRLHNEYIYLNYALQSQDPIASYGRWNRFFLRRVAHKYDPSGVFQRLVPGGFKLYRDDAGCCDGGG